MRPSGETRFVRGKTRREQGGRDTTAVSSCGRLPTNQPWKPSRLELIVIFHTEVGDHIFALQIAQSVLELHLLNEEIMLRIETGGAHRALEEEREPFLNAAHAATSGQIIEDHQIEYDRRRQNGVATEEVHLDLHRIAEPAEDVDVVPSFLAVSTRRIVVDAYLVRIVGIKVGIELRLQDVLQHREFALFLGLERLRIVQHLTVTIAQDVGGEPAVQTQQARFETGKIGRASCRERV